MSHWASRVGSNPFAFALPGFPQISSFVPTLNMTGLSLALSDYKRYGRQMILDGFGLEGMSPLLLEGYLTPNRHESDSKSPAQIEKCKGRRGRCWRTWLPRVAISRGCWIGYVVVTSKQERP